MRWIFLAPFVVLSSFCLSTIIGQAQLGITYGDAVNLGGGCYRLTNSSSQQRGAVWYFGTVDVSQSWEMTANVFMGSSNSGADGLVFVLRDPISSTLGASGSQLGYGGSFSNEAIQPSLGIEIDTYMATSYGDPWFDHIAILSNGVVDHNALETLSLPVPAMADSSNIETGEEFELRISYCVSSQQMTVFWDDQERLSQVVDLEYIGTNVVKWGFTASTGGLSNQHRVCDAQFVELEDVCDNSEGCADVTACNFDPAAEADNGTCDYSCCPGPGCCSDGMYWDYDLQVCQVIETCEDDLDGDGVVGVNDLMQLLSSFGTDCPFFEPAEWTCGDPVSYHGYDYETVLIGEQCWFAENLRTGLYQNGDSIPSNLSIAEWMNTNNGATAVYGVGDAEVQHGNENGEENLENYGRLYNFHAVQDDRNVCPFNWHVPTDEEWIELEVSMGMTTGEANTWGLRGSDQGAQLKSSSDEAPAWDGTNESGFSALPGGQKTNAVFNFQGIRGHYWTSTASGSNGILRIFFGTDDPIYGENSNQIMRGGYTQNDGESVRCIKD